MRNCRLSAVFVMMAIVGCSGESSTSSDESPQRNSTPTNESQNGSAPAKDSKLPEPSESEGPVDEPARAKPTETTYFTIRLPKDWLLEEQPPEEGDDNVTFSVKGPDESDVFAVTVATDEPRFIQCFCAPWDRYSQYDRDGIKYADLTMDIGPQKVRTLKAIGTKFGTDVHVVYENFPQDLLDEIIESVHPY